MLKEDRHKNMLKFVAENSDCKILSGDYTSNHTKLKFLCSCGSEFTTSFYQFKNANKRQCNKCGFHRSATSKRLTYDEVKRFIEVESDSGCKMLSSEYKNNHTKIEIQCSCGDVFLTSFSEFKTSTKKQCNKCSYAEQSKMVMLKYEDVFNYIENNTKCTLISSTYKGIQHHLDFLCECGKKFKAPFQSFQNGKITCNDCAIRDRSKKQAHDYSYVKHFIEIESNSGCKLLSEEYINNSTKMQFECECGNEFQASWAHFRKTTRRCKECSKLRKSESQRSNTSEFKTKVFELVGDEYDVLGEYVRARDKIKVRHNICGGEYYVTPDNFLRGKRCPQCKESVGESEVRDCLDFMSIKYIHQHSYDDCRNIRPLLFDFYLPDYNLLIEYDGEHHYEPVDFAGKGCTHADDKLEYTKQNDSIKNQYCKDNDIQLLRIPYWDFDNIKEILDKHINQTLIKEE